jgi:hypothetical protein
VAVTERDADLGQQVKALRDLGLVQLLHTLVFVAHL